MKAMSGNKLQIDKIGLTRLLKKDEDDNFGRFLNLLILKYLIIILL